MGKESFKITVLGCAVLLSVLLFCSCDELAEEPTIDPAVGPPDVPCLNVELGLRNYFGNTENIHPKVLFFEKGWNGYMFWMAYTPYPKGDTKAENPCIAVSNDGIIWGVPLNFRNPLSFAPEKGYNSDTHLVYDPESDSLECWWREVDTSGKAIDAFHRRVSRDGVNWSDRETVYDFDPENVCRLSPAVSIVDGRYYMVFSDSANLHEVWGERLTDGSIKWSEPRLIDVPFKGNTLNIWHQDMIIDNHRNVEMIICAFDRAKKENNNSADLYMLSYNLDDPESVTAPVLIKRRSPLPESITNRSIYRSSLVKVNGMYMVYISSIDKDWHRHMMLSTGASLLDLTDSPI